MSNVHTQVTPELSDYIRRVSLREPELLTRLRRETAALPMARMQISPEQGQFMQLLVRLQGAVNTIEVGVFTGYSSLCVAQALPPGGKVVACDVSQEWTNVGKPYWKEAGVEDKIDLRIAPAITTLDSLIAEGRRNFFDFAFIDADKQNYRNYYERMLVLVRKGGIIAIDNVLWHGSVADPSVQDADTQAIRSLNEMLLQDARIFLTLVPIGDGLTLALKL